MFNQIVTYIIPFVVPLVILCVAGTMIYIAWLRRRYTRERFAFVSLSVITILIANVITLFAKGDLISQIVVAILKKLGLEVGNVTIGYQDKFIILILVILAIAMVIYFHRNWHGPISTIDAKDGEMGRPKSGMIRAAIIQVEAWSGKTEIKIFVEGTHEDKYEIFQPIETDKLPWHIRAAQLLILSDPQYQIDLGDYDIYKVSLSSTERHNTGKDWHREFNCFISSYGTDEERIALYCSDKAPNKEELDSFIDFVKSRSGTFFKLIVAIEHEEGPKHTEEIKGFKVEYRHKEEMLNQLVNFKGFQNSLRKEFFEGKLPNSDVALTDIYTELSAKHINIENEVLKPGEQIDRVEKYILEWVLNDEHPNEHLALLGEYGQGKSVLSQKISIEMLKHPDKYHRIPIIIELRGTSPRNMNPLSLLGHFGNVHAISPQALYQLHKEGKLLIILEAFDEMDLVGDTEMLMSHFQQLWQLARTPKSKIIITGRPNLFIDNVRRRRALGINLPRLELPYTSAVLLNSMTEVQIANALRSSTEDKRVGILTALQKSGRESSFAELAARPSTLYQLSVVWDRKADVSNEDLNAAAIIGEFLQYNYERQEAKHKANNEKPLITVDERGFFMMGIATGMMLDDDYSNQISKQKLTDIVRQLLDNFPKQLPPHRDASNGLHTDNLLVRLKENKDGFDTVLKDVLASGILVLDLSGSDVFKFAHKSSMEYLVSDFYTNFVLQEDERDFDLIITNAIANTFTFKEKSLRHNTDVDNFTSQLISNRIQLKDIKGQPLPVEGNEKIYVKTIYKKLVPGWVASFMPTLTAYLKLDNGLIWNHVFALITLMLSIIFIITRKENMAVTVPESLLFQVYG